MKTNHRGFVPLIALLIILGIVAVGGGAYYVTQKNQVAVPIQNEAQATTTVKTETTKKSSSASVKVDAATDWQTYSSEEGGYNFTFQYPASRIQISYYENAVVHFALLPSPSMFTSGPFLRVEAFQTVGTDLNKWVDNFLTKDAATKSGIEKTTVTIGDTQWIKFTYQDKTNPESWSVGVDYIALKNGDIFRVSYSKSLPENDALFEKMVHSIAFTPLIVQKIETPQTPKELAQDANYYYVPEMRLRFKKIVGFTPLYTAGTNSVHFTSKELNEGVKGTVFSDCATDLSSLWIVSANEEDPIGSFKVKALSNEKSLWGSGHQAPCWYDPTDAGMSSQSLQEKYAKDSGYIAYSKQGELFGKFIASVELY